MDSKLLCSLLSKGTFVNRQGSQFAQVVVKFEFSPHITIVDFSMFSLLSINIILSFLASKVKKKTPINKTLKTAIIKPSMVNRYNFSVIFQYDPLAGTITPKFNVAINGVPFNRGIAIYKGTSFGGLNLFNYIGRSIAGTWDSNARVLTILGFY
ncbi:MAG: hypothetical protein A3H50_01300 [Candidatus Levybacteria bacterium RIFCSPLOWO2_02_FULL_37_10]|nr:MAG: hypothetical protein A2860_00015 [Candidatus Levybacteria bacterium RIFCSPHIGHO2_01_FULL_37_33]OGH16888.1 MAG: hypothetical protein A3C97_00530 [Candidatus Levybacteria bacterium RIFCSPHIGHO2_02_FULL_37_11]OGH29209.1 MAG: hypothetical protein A3F30_04405 [Candidatus Levybacteria bacterium RIFCSPHIGHO2_12_FULL_37_12]OGH44029.1 MAG: hypothetical protein A3H50_01300 [Candidatus Levybacteria bacterium RIFCSPLOWO2_02_FULL_37_10]